METTKDFWIVCGFEGRLKLVLMTFARNLIKNLQLVLEFQEIHSKVSLKCARIVRIFQSLSPIFAVRSGPRINMKQIFFPSSIVRHLKGHKNFSGAWIERVEEAEVVPLTVIAFIEDCRWN